MEYFAISVFKRELRKALRKADQGPVGITKNGKLILVLVSIQTYELLHKYKDLPLE
jgi:prevent-host-death family protein